MLKKIAFYIICCLSLSLWSQMEAVNWQFQNYGGIKYEFSCNSSLTAFDQIFYDEHTQLTTQDLLIFFSQNQIKFLINNCLSFETSCI